MRFKSIIKRLFFLVSTLSVLDIQADRYHVFCFILEIKYFSSGDIGEWLANGTLKIIDRKKQIFKVI